MKVEFFGTGDWVELSCGGAGLVWLVRFTVCRGLRNLLLIGIETRVTCFRRPIRTRTGSTSLDIGLFAHVAHSLGHSYRYQLYRQFSLPGQTLRLRHEQEVKWGQELGIVGVKAKEVMQSWCSFSLCGCLHLWIWNLNLKHPMSEPERDIWGMHQVT